MIRVPKNLLSRQSKTQKNTSTTQDINTQNSVPTSQVNISHTLQHYNTATARLQRSWNQNLVILYIRQSLYTTTQLLQGSSEAGAKSWSFYTQDKAYTLQHSYSKAPVKLEPKFGPSIHNTKPTHYNTATTRLH